MSSDRKPKKVSVTTLPASPKRTIVIATLALCSGLAIIFAIRSVGSEVHPGVIQVEQTQVLTPRNARVATILVQSDEVIKPNQPVAQLVDSELDDQLILIGVEVRLLESELEQLKAQTIVNQLLKAQPIEKDIHDNELQLASLLQESFRNKLESVAWNDYRDEPARFDDNFLSEQVLAPVSWIPTTVGEALVRSALRQEDAQNAAEVVKVKISLCEKRLVTLRQQRTVLMENVSMATGSKTAQARLEQATVRMKALQRNKDALLLRSDGYGVAGTFRVKPGDRVDNGDPIVSILDRDQTFVIVRVRSQLCNRITAGSVVQLHFPGGVLRTGEIKTVPLQTELSSEPNSESTHLSLHVTPSGKAWPELPVGTSVGVSFRD